MKIEIQHVNALNPSIVRVSLVTYDGETYEESTNYKYYELAIPTDDFTVENNGNVDIDGDKFQQLVTERVVAANKSAEIAAFITGLDLVWEVILKPQEVTEDSNTKLAYGSDNESIDQ